MIALSDDLSRQYQNVTLGPDEDGIRHSPGSTADRLRRRAGRLRSVAAFADKPTLHGTKVVLRPIVASDAEAMFAGLDDPEAKRLTGTHQEFTREVIEQWAASRAEQADRLDLAIADAATGDWAGELAINDWDPDNRSCGIRIAVEAAYRDRGVGTEAMRLAIDYVFESLPIHRLSLEVFSFNPRAIAVYRKLGFVQEGVLRDALYWDGEFHDTILMSILRPDWETR